MEKQISLVCILLFLVSCTKPMEPKDVVMDYKLLMGYGKVDEASKYLSKNNRELQHYFTNPEVVAEEYIDSRATLPISITIEEQDKSTLAAHLKPLYDDEYNTFEEESLILIKEDGEWRIHDEELYRCPEIAAIKYYEMSKEVGVEGDNPYMSEDTKKLVAMGTAMGRMSKNTDKEGWHSMTAQRLNVSDTKARVMVTYKDKNDLKQSETVNLIKEDGEWKVDIEKRR